MDRGILFEGPVELWADRGDALHLRELAKALQGLGFRAHVLCLDGPPAPPSSSLSEIRVRVPQVRGIFQALYNTVAAAKAVAAVRRHGLDLIYSRATNGLVAASLAARITRRPLVVEINGLPTVDIRLARGPGLQTALIGFWERWVHAGADLLVAAPGVARFYEEELGAPTGRICQVPLGVDLDMFSPGERASARARLGLPEAPTVLWLGNMAPWQGLDVLAATMPLVVGQVPDARFLLVGDGRERAGFEATVCRNGLRERCLFTGLRPHDELPSYVRAADVCIATFPSKRGRRGTISALKTSSYLAVGRPVVTSDMDELAAEIEACGAGAWFAADDHRALAVRIATHLREHGDAWERRCQAARAMAVRAGGWAGAAERVRAAIEPLMRPLPPWRFVPHRGTK